MKNWMICFLLAIVLAPSSARPEAGEFEFPDVYPNCILLNWSNEEAMGRAAFRYFKTQKLKQRFSILDPETVSVERGKTPEGYDFIGVQFRFIDPRCTRMGSYQKKYVCIPGAEIPGTFEIRTSSVLRSCNNKDACSDPRSTAE